MKTKLTDSQFFLCEDVLQKILYRLSIKDLTQNTRLVSKDWYAHSRASIKQLMSEFSIPMDIVNSLKSPHLVYERLERIFISENELYTLYCSSNSIDSNFIHLLDNDINWFKNYFANRDQFFLRFNFSHACIIGNFDLVKFLNGIGCRIDEDFKDLYSAIRSGELDLIKFLLKFFGDLIPIRTLVCRAAVQSGNVDSLKYILKEFDWPLTDEELILDISSNSIEMISFLAENYELDAKQIDLSYSIKPFHLTDLAITKYLFEELMWQPKPVKKGQDYTITTLWNFAYCKGFMNVANYLALKFPEHIKVTMEHLIKFGNLDELKQRLRIEDLKKTCIAHPDYGQLLLKWAFQSGKLAILKFLVEDCNIIPVNPYLTTVAIRSNKVEMVRYLVEGYGFKIQQDLFDILNLELASFLYNHMGKNSFFKCLEPAVNLIVLYHLIQTGKQPCSAMFDFVFQCCFEEDGEHNNLAAKAKHFMKYLIEVHGIFPTNEMKAVAELEDMEMRAIFEYEQEDSSYSSSM